MKNLIIKFSAILALSGVISLAQAGTGDTSFHLKTGAFALDETSQLIGFIPVSFDESSTSVFAIEYEKQTRNNASWGIEIINYSNEFIGLGGLKMDSFHLIFNSRQYFKTSSSMLPYVGGGIGVNTVDVSGATGSGLTFQLMAGVKFNFSNSLAALLEYKYILADAEDDVGDTLDVSGTGIFAGLVIDF